MLSKSLILGFVGSLLVTFSVWAGTSVLEGVVKDPNGRPIKGADVRIEAKKFSKIVKTDARGHYILDGLGVGTYKVTLVQNGQVKGSLDAKTEAGKATRLDLNLTGQAAAAKKRTHMVYMRPDVDTHIGGGSQWVEVDENGNIVKVTQELTVTSRQSLEPPCKARRSGSKRATVIEIVVNYAREIALA